MLRKKQLIEMLAGVPDEWEISLLDVQNGQGPPESIHHVGRYGDVIILASRASIGTHTGPNGCGCPVFEIRESEQLYKGQCPLCDESLYSFEIEFREKKDPLAEATPRATYELQAVPFADGRDVTFNYQVYEADETIEDIDDNFYARVTSEQELKNAVRNGEEFCGLIVKSYIRTSEKPR